MLTVHERVVWAEATVARSSCTLATSRRLLDRSHHQLWATWRTLAGTRPPIAGGAVEGGRFATECLRDLVRDGLTSGRLPRIKRNVGACPLAAGRSCAVCGEPIKTAPTPEYELDDGGTFVAHWAC